MLEVREQMGEIIRLMRADLELTQSLSNPDFTPAQRKDCLLYTSDHALQHPREALGSLPA